MLIMSQIGEIRRMKEVEGYSIKEITRRLSVSRNTVRKVLREDRVSDNKYRRKKPHRSKLGPYLERLEEMIEANEKLARRDRRTATSLYEELQGYGYSGAVDSVRRYVKRWRDDHGGAACSEAFIPLVFAPGDAMQFDWSHEVVRLGGVDTIVKVAQMRLCHSRLCLVQAFALERQEMMLEGIRRAFHFFGGVPRRLIVDNLKAAVRVILTGKNRIWQDNFEGFCAHYLIDPRACTPRKPNEKGQVERQVGVLRERFFRPRVEAADFDELNDRLLSQCVELAKRNAHPQIKAKSVYDMWREEEKHTLIALPPADYECCRTEDEKRVGRDCTVAFDANRYSVPSRYVGKRVSVRGYAEQVKIIHDGKQVAQHKRSFGRGQSAYDPMHYLDVLEKKPGAIENGSPFINWRLPQAYETAREILSPYETDGDREFVKLLLLIRDYGLDNATAALALALEQGIVRAGYVENILHRLLDKEPATPPGEVQATVALACEPAADPAVYDRTLRKEAKQ